MLFAIGYLFFGFLTVVWVRGLGGPDLDGTHPAVMFVITLFWPLVAFYMAAEFLGGVVEGWRARRHFKREADRQSECQKRDERVLAAIRGGREANGTSEDQDNVAQLDAKLRGSEDRERMPA